MDPDIATIQVQSKALPGEQSIDYPLSRFSQAEGPAKPSLAHKISDDVIKFVAVTATPKAIKVKSLLSYVYKQWKLERRQVQAVVLPASGELCVIGDFILKGTRIVIPRKMRPQVLVLAHRGHPGIFSMKQRLRPIVRVTWNEQKS